MLGLFVSIVAALRSSLRTRAALQLEILAFGTRSMCCRGRSVGGFTRPRRTGGSDVPLVRLALCPGHREAGDGDRLAPPGIPAVLDLEE